MASQRGLVSGTRSSQHLDLIRGLAAVAVLLYHVRYRFFLDYAEVPDRNALAVAWYVVTSFGHDAVMVFFVLSGFLIGSSVLRGYAEGRWGWRDYLTSRMVRLYVVLIPGLLLTSVWDQLGLHWFSGHEIYSGMRTAYTHDYFPVAQRAGVGVLAGNAMYLQGILVPPFGSNDALWSLSFEFWYYIAFPLFAAAAFTRRSTIRVGAFVLGLGVLYLVGGQIARYFPIWLLGVAVALMPPRPIGRRLSPVTASVALIGLGGVVAATHTSLVRSHLGDSLWATDTVTAVTFAIYLYVVLQDTRPAVNDAYGSAAARLSNCSFSLYVLHLPVLVFLRAWLLPGRPWAPTALTIALGLTIAAAVFVYSALIASVTEAHTATVRRRLLGRRRTQPV